MDNLSPIGFYTIPNLGFNLVDIAFAIVSQIE